MDRPEGPPSSGSWWAPDGTPTSADVPTTPVQPASPSPDATTVQPAATPVASAAPPSRLTVLAIDFGFVALAFVAVPFLIASAIAWVMGAAPPLPAGLLALLIVTPAATLIYAVVVLVGSASSVGRTAAGSLTAGHGSGRMLVVALPVLLALIGAGAAGSYVGDRRTGEILGMSIEDRNNPGSSDLEGGNGSDGRRSESTDPASSTTAPSILEATCTGTEIEFAIDGVATVDDGILLELVADNSCSNDLGIDGDLMITLGTELGPLFSEVPVRLGETQFAGGAQTRTTVTITESDIAQSTGGIDGGYEAVRSTVGAKVSGGQTQDFFLVWACELEELQGSETTASFSAESDSLPTQSECNDAIGSANWPPTTYGPVMGCPDAPSGTPNRPEASTDERGWIGILESIPITDPELVNRRFEAFASTGLELKLLDSRKFTSLRDPYWVIYGGPFSTKDEASAWCENAPDGLTGQCYPRALQ